MFLLLQKNIKPQQTREGHFMLVFPFKTPLWLFYSLNYTLIHIFTACSMWFDLDLAHFWLCLSLHPQQMQWRWTTQWLLLLGWENKQNNGSIVTGLWKNKMHSHRHNFLFKVYNSCYYNCIPHNAYRNV